MSESGALARKTAQDVARRSYGKLVAFLAARTRDVAAAEDALSEAFASALAHWPERGIPDNPEAWLLAAARRKAIDAVRTTKRGAEASEHLTLMAEELSAAPSRDIPDERLALMFACAHPAIDEGVRAPLMLQTVLGFDAATIASAFLIAPSSMSQRLVRAKTKIRESGIPFRVPERDDLGERLETVLDAIYAAYTEGWSDPAGTDAHRRGLAAEAIWLCRLVVMLLPKEPEALGLLALMLHSEARREARRDADGEFVPLSDQDTQVWNGAMMDEAEAHLRSAGTMNAIGRFQLEAAVQSAHAVRRISGSADWNAILKLYDALLKITGSPVVAINRAVAIAEIRGAMKGLSALDAVDDKRLSQYQPYWAARAELHARANDTQPARAAYERAIGLESDPAIRRYLQRKQAALAPQTKTLNAIEQTFENAAQRCADITPLVYARLFARHPQMEPLFVRDTTGNVRGEMLVRAVEVIFDFLGPNAYAENFLKCEAVTHDGYGVPPEIFSDFFECLRDTLRDVIAQDWTPGMEKDWCELLRALGAFSAARVEAV